MPRRKRLALAAVLACLLAGFLGGPAQAARSKEDVSLFYEALAPYGKWVDYGQYGPVWYPEGVPQDWRPYVNGRFVPTEAGWVFETEEPWGWATYHYGNWLPTLEYGWVWAPGSTWYPSTVAWRTDDEYVGWAPVPPPDYEPVPAYYPAGGYYPGISPLDLLTPFFWNFCPISAFPLNFWNPFAPAFTFGGCGCLVPFNRFPFFFARTLFLTNFFQPVLFPGAFFAFGPPFSLFPGFTQINIFANKVVIVNLKNGAPPKEMLAKNAALRETVPAPILKGEPLAVQGVKDAGLAGRQLNRPDAGPRPKNIPALKAEIPKAYMLPGSRTIRAGTAPAVRASEQHLTTPPPAAGVAPRVESLSPGIVTPPATGQAPVSRRARMIEVAPGTAPHQVPLVQPGTPPAPQARLGAAPSRRVMQQERLQEMQLRQQLRQEAVGRQLGPAGTGQLPAGKAIAPRRAVPAPSGTAAPKSGASAGKGLGGAGLKGGGLGGLGLGR